MNFYQTIWSLVLSLVGFSSVFAAPAVLKSTPTIVNTHLTAPQQKVNVNTAQLTELIKVEGITLPKARSLVSYRKKHHGFKSLAELIQVPGFKRMKPEVREQIKQHLSL